MDEDQLVQGLRSRDPEAVQEDVRNDLLTVDQAQQLYAVVINRQTLDVEREATAAMRARMERSIVET